MTTWLLYGTTLRTARKAHSCWECNGSIEVGERYAEYLGESAAYQSGKRYHLRPCAAEQGVVIEAAECPRWHAPGCSRPFNAVVAGCPCGGRDASYEAVR